MYDARVDKVDARSNLRTSTIALPGTEPTRNPGRGSWGVRGVLVSLRTLVPRNGKDFFGKVFTVQLVFE